MSGGELVVKTGLHGELMMENFLKAIGWTNLAKNAQFECSLGSRQKLNRSKGERNNHNVDGIFHYDNPLNHKGRNCCLFLIET